MQISNYPSAKARREAIEKEFGLSLDHIGIPFSDEELASSRHCENMIGTVQVPVGVAGPLLVASHKKEYLLPIATTEGALVASISRGAKAITKSGGAKVISKKIGITRAPVFGVAGIEEGEKFIRCVEEKFKEIKKICEATSSHLTLLEIRPWMMGREVFLRFRFDTQDAMGMNMATIATSAACEFISRQTGATLLALSGNLCVDKKTSALNFILGRGISIWAEVVLSSNVLTNILKTTAEKFFQTSQAKLVYGSTLAGSLAQNAQIANVLTGIFLATGQDIGHVAECSQAVTTVEKNGEDIYISVYLPDLVIGTVGGGTSLTAQKEALSILGIRGGDNGKNSQKFAEIIAASCLAGEISLLASLSENSLASAHKKLARGEK